MQYTELICKAVIANWELGLTVSVCIVLYITKTSTVKSIGPSVILVANYRHLREDDVDLGLTLLISILYIIYYIH